MMSIVEIILTVISVMGLALFVDGFKKSYDEMLKETEGVENLYAYEERRRSTL